MGKKYTTDEIHVGGHNLNASMMENLNTVVSNHTSYLTSLPSHTHDDRYVREGGTSFSGVYPMVVRVSNRSIYSDADITFTGSTSQLHVGGSVKSPIFYDSNNTGYYLNPDGTSSMYRLELNNHIDMRAQTGVWIEADVFADAVGWNPNSGTYIGTNIGGNRYLRANGTFYDGSGDRTLFHTGNFTNNSGNWNTAYTHSQAAHAPTNAEANVYSTASELLTAIKTVDGSGSGLDADKLDGYNSGQNGSNVILRTAGNNYLYINSWIHPANGTGLFYDAGVHFHETGNYMYSNTSLQAANDMRAPIFYDRDNTGYYLNPASTSNLYDLSLTGAKHTYLYINPGNGYEAMVRFNGASGDTWYVGSRTTTQLLGSQDAYHVYSATASRTVGGYDTGGNHFAYGSSRAPVFYDSDNTGYYLNPAGTSNLNTVAIAGITTLSGRLNLDLTTDYDSTVVTGLTQAPMQIADVNIGSTDAYLPLAHMSARYTSGYRTHMNIGLKKTASAWGDSTTGMYVALGGNDSYPTRNWLFSYGGYIRSGVDGVYATDSFRAPIFYDSNNTGYYLNPASTSNLNTLNAATINRNPVVTLSGDVTGNATMTNLGSINITTTVANNSHEHSYIKAGGNGPSTEDLNSVADSVAVGELSYRGYNSSSTNKPPANDNANGVITVGQHSGGYNAQVAFSSNGNMYWRDNPSSSNGSWRTIWDSDNDGSGSGLDADLLDGQHASAFAPVSHTHTWANIYGETANSVNAWGGLRHQTNDGYIDFGPANSSYAHIYTDTPSFYFNKKLIVNNGSIVNQNDVRAGVFYDINDTGYYLNPASTSLLNTVNAPVYNVTAGNDNGIGFWADQTNYTIKMGNTQQDHGTVTNYSMHFNMGSSAGRGFTFGSSRTAVSASINALTGAANFSGAVTWSGGSSANANTAYTHSQAAHAPTNAEANVQADWNATSGDALILNKPTIPQGDITNVTAGNGLTGGGASGSVTLNVVGGDGITANNDNITVDSTVVRTSGNQTIDGIKEFNTHIAMESSHLINYRFEMLEPANPQYILLCRNSGAQDVNGVIRMDRTSGNYQASSVEVIVSSGSSAMFGGTLRTLQVLQSSEDYRLISCTHNSTDWIAIKYTGNTYPETSGAFFTGRITQSSGFLTVVSSGVTNEAAFGGNSESYNEVDSFVVSGTMSASGGDSTDWNTAYTHSQATHAPTNAEANVQSDWNATSGDALILNKPTIPTDHGDHDGLYLPIGGKAADSELLDGINSTSFLRSDANDSFSGTLTGSAQIMMEPNDYGKGVYGQYSSTKFQHVWGMGSSWHLNASGSNLGNFYGIAYTHSNVGAGSQSGFSHQTLFVENGVTRTWIGRGVRTVGDLMSDISVKAPIFYDSNNTSYYVNPAGTSTVNGVKYINNTIPIVVKVNSGFKSWAHHISSNDDYVLAPSTTDGSETWDWNNGFNFKTTGDIMANNFLLRSDERLKTKITDLPCDNIDVAWKSFELKSDEGNYRTGVIAQELEKTNPEFVDTDDKGFKSVKYIDLLIAKIAELEARLEKLEK